MPLAINLEAFETTIQPAEEPNAFHRLVRDLSRILGPSSGLDSAEVIVTDIENLMQKYSSNTSEWKQYAFGDPNQTFTRNLVDRGNGKSNLLILVWTSRKESPIHDHANSHCVMKILQGSLKETLYEWPDQDALDKGKKSPLRIKKETIYSENQVTYMCDKLGLHKIENPDPARFAVSLHLYTPPNAAKFGCSMFDQDTGASSHMKSSQYFSEMGQLTQKSEKPKHSEPLYGDYIQ